MATTTMTPASTSTPAEPAEPVSAAPSGSETDQSNGSQASEASEQSESQTSDSDEQRDESGKLLSREAAGYRRRLRDTEAERDSLREQLDRVQRTEVERLASVAGLAVPGDVWQFGANLQTLRSDDGSIDAETVNGLVGSILKDRPGLQAPKIGDLGMGRGGSARPRNWKPEPGLSQLLKPGN